MKIRDRLTLKLSLTVFLALSGLGLSIYYFTANFHKKEFFTRLEDRVKLTELIFLEKNELVTQAVRETFLHSLDDEKEYVITLLPSGLDSLDRLFFPGFSKKIMEENSIRFWQENRQGFGKIYNLQGGKSYAVVVTALDKFGETKLLYLRQILLAGVFLCLLILVGVSWFTTRNALRPLENTIQQASRTSTTQLNLRMDINNPDDELGQLAIAFNNMLDRLQTGFQAQKNFVRNASHEIRNPLTAIIGEAELVLEKERPVNEYQESLRIISFEAERLKFLTQQLLELEKAESMASLPSPEPESIELLLLEVAEKFPASRLKLQLPEKGKVRLVKANYYLLFTAISNLIDNALKYSGDKPVVVKFEEFQDFFQISVCDEGIGIPAQDLPIIYTPMHRARNARNIKGHGIGLPLAKRIIELHNGTIDIKTEEGAGTEVSVRLPVY
jgi:signal transduction histidine kinase